MAASGACWLLRVALAGSVEDLSKMRATADRELIALLLETADKALLPLSPPASPSCQRWAATPDGGSTPTDEASPPSNRPPSAERRLTGSVRIARAGMNAGEPLYVRTP